MADNSYGHSETHIHGGRVHTVPALRTAAPHIRLSGGVRVDDDRTGGLHVLHRAVEAGRRRADVLLGPRGGHLHIHDILYPGVPHRALDHDWRGVSHAGAWHSGRYDDDRSPSLCVLRSQDLPLPQGRAQLLWRLRRLRCHVDWWYRLLLYFLA